MFTNATGEPCDYYMNNVTFTNAWRCGNCGQWVNNVFHNCWPTALSPIVLTQPEHKPHVCPVCGGRGEVNVPRPVDSELRSETCPACKGACVLWG